MAGNNYGPMHISGNAAVHNGDDHSVNINNNFLVVADCGPLNLEDLSNALTRTSQHCEAIDTYLKRPQCAAPNSVSLAEDVTDLRDSLDTLRFHVDENDFGELTASSDCRHSLHELAVSLDQYQLVIEDLHSRLQGNTLPAESSDEVSQNSQHGFLAIRRSLKRLRQKIGVTIMIVNFCVQRNFQQQNTSQISELKCQLEAVQAELEMERVSRLSGGSALEHDLLERAALPHDPDHALQVFLQGSQPNKAASNPTTASMQVSTITPDPISDTVTFATAQEHLASPDESSTTLVRAIQVFVRGIPDVKTLLLSVKPDDSIATVKEAMLHRLCRRQLDFDLFRHDTKLLEASTVVEAGIQPLSTLLCVPVTDRARQQFPWKVKHLTGRVEEYFPKMPAGRNDLLIIDLKLEICQRTTISLDRQRLIYRGLELQDSEHLLDISDTIFFIIRLPSSTLNTRSLKSSEASWHGQRGKREESDSETTCSANDDDPRLYYLCLPPLAVFRDAIAPVWHKAKTLLMHSLFDVVYITAWLHHTAPRPDYHWEAPEYRLDRTAFTYGDGSGD